KSDGTAAGTVLVKDLYPGERSSAPVIVNVNGTLFLCATTPDLGRELWKSDGTAEGTVLVADLSPGAGSTYFGDAFAVGDTLFFAGAVDDAFGGNTELYMSDGTEAGTVLVSDIVPGPGSSSPSNLTKVGNTLFFTVQWPNSEAIHLQLWKVGQTSGASLVKDLAPGPNLTNIFSLTDVNGTLFFAG